MFPVLGNSDSEVEIVGWCGWEDKCESARVHDRSFTHGITDAAARCPGASSDSTDLPRPVQSAGDAWIDRVCGTGTLLERA